MLERLGLGTVLDRLPSPVARFYTMLVVMVGWVFFRADDTGMALNHLSIMFSPTLDMTATLGYFTKALVGLGAGIMLCILPDKIFPAPTSRNPNDFSRLAMAIQALLFFLSLASLMGSSRNPFIYFNF